MTDLEIVESALRSVGNNYRYHEYSNVLHAVADKIKYIRLEKQERESNMNVSAAKDMIKMLRSI